MGFPRKEIIDDGPVRGSNLISLPFSYTEKLSIFFLRDHCTDFRATFW